MIISKINESYVWVWLPGETAPCVAGKLSVNKKHHRFYYGQSYLVRDNAIALAPNLPLNAGQVYESEHALHLVFRDALPDAWGRRILQHSYQQTELSYLQMLNLSSSDRIGALHFQDSAKTFKPRYENHATMEELLQAVELLETGQPIPEALQHAIIHGTSIGGARPKAIIDDGHGKWIAKFSSTTDVYPIVQAEFAAMWLAKRVGLRVPTVQLCEVANKFALLVERFDRISQADNWQRTFMVSGLTLLGLDDMEGRYASYLDLADQMRRYACHATQDLHELYKRMIFNIIIGNTDDHGKNHAFFWDGQYYTLTPAYDLCPCLRVSQEATQAMIVGEADGAHSTLNNARSSCEYFDLTMRQADSIIEELVNGIETYWETACQKAKLTAFQAKQYVGTAILNPYIFY